VAKDYQLLDTARDYFQFVTNFFEVINISATHVYHSALELSPLSSVVRKLYHSHRPNPLPRVVIGIEDSWEPSTAVSTKNSFYLSSTWSPRSQVIAVATQEAIEVRDALALKPLFTLHSSKVGVKFRPGLAYSPEGHSLASCSETSIVIWDTQTGGIVTKIECEVAGSGLELMWSLDGKLVCTVSPRISETITVHTYNIVSGTMLSVDTLQSNRDPYLWALDGSVQIVTTVQDRKGWAINIFESGATLTKVKSFPIQFKLPFQVFSPATYRILVPIAGEKSHSPEFLIVDLQSSEVLLRTTGSYLYPTFSPDASLFAAFTKDHLTIWKYASGHYVHWREFLQTPSPIQFSPASLSILACSGTILNILNLSYSSTTLAVKPTAALHGHSLDAFSPNGTFIATAYQGGDTITITNLTSQYPTPIQFIETELEILALVLTGKVLLVRGQAKAVAWLLTEEGTVDGIVGNTRADYNDSLWEISLSLQGSLPVHITGNQNKLLKFSVKDEMAALSIHGYTIHSYHNGTGEILKPAQVPPHLGCTWYHFDNQQRDGCNKYYHDLYKHQGLLNCEWPISQAILQEGWVKDPEGRHQLWVHPHWRLPGNDVGWLNNVTTLRLRNSSKLLIVKL
jgi:hypothetical protein